MCADSQSKDGRLCNGIMLADNADISPLGVVLDQLQCRSKFGSVCSPAGRYLGSRKDVGDSFLVVRDVLIHSAHNESTLSISAVGSVQDALLMPHGASQCVLL